MPLGNGDIGANVWVDDKGDLLFYLSKTDSWSENARLLKVGRVRIGARPRLEKIRGFRHELDTSRGKMTVEEVGPKNRIEIVVMVDANHPMVRVELQGREPFGVEAVIEVWRNARRRLGESENFSAYGARGGPAGVYVTPDRVIDRSDRVTWYHRNRKSIYPMTLRLQGMEDWCQGAEDPLLDRTFGGTIWGPGFVNRGGVLTSSGKRRSHGLNIHLLTSTCPDAGDWMSQPDRFVQALGYNGSEKRSQAHAAWWREFWNRSWIRVHAAGSKGDCISCGYRLQRYINACGGRGQFPIKFNGSIFTVDAEDKGRRFDADYRRWGGPYWFQNTRLPYWSMLLSGDFDLMQPLFGMYMRALPLARRRTRKYFGHGGVFLPETMFFWGSYANENYGWDREGRDSSYVENRYIRWHYNSGLELLAMLLDYFRWTEDRQFLKETLLPFAGEIMTFYDQHYERDDSGMILLQPSQALETYQSTVNPTPDIAGLIWDLDGLLGLREVDDSLRERWSQLRSQVPQIPLSRDEPNRILPAERVIEGPNNCENPELYTAFPYRIFGVGKPGLEVGRATFAQRRFKGNRGWQQDDIHAAMLGLGQEAGEMLTDRFSAKDPNSRFPAFWGPNFDWVPDQDHGCAGMIALQRMAMQCEGRRILILPAWPGEWDVDFRLHAPFRTTVSGRFRSGELVKVLTNPKSREKDLVLPEGPLTGNLL